MAEDSFSSREGSVRASIVVPAHNKPEDVQKAVRSLEVQVRERDDVELIVVDDGSEPPLETFLNGSDQHFTLVRNDSVLGRSAARNRGVKAARGDIIIFMDSDMTAHPRFVDKHLEIHDKIESVAIVGHVIWTGRSRLHRYLESRGVKKLKKNEAVPGRYFDSSNASLRRSEFERAGSFHEGIKEWGGEDTLIGLSLHDGRVPLIYLRSAITYHHSKIDLDEMCSKNYTFGKCSLPVLVSSNPEIARELRTHYLTAPSGEEGGILKRWGPRILVRGLLRFPGQSVVKRLLAVSGKRLAFLCYDYLIYSNILRGFRDSLMSEPGAAAETRQASGDSSDK